MEVCREALPLYPLVGETVRRQWLRVALGKRAGGRRDWLSAAAAEVHQGRPPGTTKADVIAVMGMIRHHFHILSSILSQLH